MKVIVSNDLRSRLKCAASNGSVIARDILAELKKNNDVSETIRGKANYFSTKKKKNSNETPVRMKVIFTGCTKDLSNTNFPDRNNPEAPWITENRSDLDPSTFAKLFKNLPDYSDTEFTYFASAICINSKVKVDIYHKLSDFIYAYSADNYANVVQQGDCPLHNSCMRHDFLVGKVSDFYFNFAGAKIIIAKNNEGAVLGRALVWENVTFEKDNETYLLSLVDRVYFTHTFVNNLIINHAKQKGIKLRRMHNDTSSPTHFVVLNEAGECDLRENTTLTTKLSVSIPASKWHKQGAPYLDTFHILYTTDNGEIRLRNTHDNDTILSLHNTDGTATIINHYCPMCGNRHHSGSKLCAKCYNANTAETFVGRIFTGRVTKYKGEIFPAAMVKNGKPIIHFQIYLQLEKLSNS